MDAPADGGKLRIVVSSGWRSNSSQAKCRKMVVFIQSLLPLPGIACIQTVSASECTRSIASADRRADRLSHALGIMRSISAATASQEQPNPFRQKNAHGPVCLRFCPAYSASAKAHLFNAADLAKRCLRHLPFLEVFSNLPSKDQGVNGAVMLTNRVSPQRTWV